MRRKGAKFQAHKKYADEGKRWVEKLQSGPLLEARGSPNPPESSTSKPTNRPKGGSSSSPSAGPASSGPTGSALAEYTQEDGEYERQMFETTRQNLQAAHTAIAKYREEYLSKWKPSFGDTPLQILLKFRAVVRMRLYEDLVTNIDSVLEDMEYLDKSPSASFITVPET